MKVPLSWLRDYVEITVPVATLIERLTLGGLEVSGVRILGVPAPEGVAVKAEDAGPAWDRETVVIAQVKGVEKHPNADKLTLVDLDYGSGRTRRVVTGAPNLKVGDHGQKVVLGLAGTTYFDGHVTPKALKKLEPKAIRGIMNDAMVMSEFELGISDEHAGIIILEDEAPVGTPLVDYMGDIVLELEITPNMARCLSMLGVAREVAALTGGRLKPPVAQFPANGGPIAGKLQVRIEDPKLCARYAAGLLRDSTIGPAPVWMQRRLLYAGMRPISNVVDVTNYVMLEWGQPLHAFDYDKLVERAKGQPPTIIVRSAKPGEVLVTLDSNRRELTAENLVIADMTGPIALAGVMGGLETEVTAQTKNILLESANFDFVSVRRTMRALNLPSEASVRFSKGLHPETVVPAARRALELMHKSAGAAVCEGLVDSYPAPLPEQKINLDMREVKRVLGTAFSIDEASRTLTALEFTVEKSGPEMLKVTTPPHRRDIEAGAADLIEELVRIHGYDKLPATLLADELPQQRGNRPLELEEKVRDVLVRGGLQEVITYALTTEEREKPLEMCGEYVRILNPISSERSVMRRTVLAGVLEVAAANLRHTDSVRLFEVGHVYLPKAGAKLPEEPRRLAIVLCGRRWREFWQDTGKLPAGSVDFFDFKGVIGALADDLHLGEVSYQPAKSGHLHPGLSAAMMLSRNASDARSLGSFGQLHPKVAESFGLPAEGVLAAELDLDAILAAVPERFRYAPVPRFPAALRDIAVIVEDSMPAERVLAEIRAGGGKLLHDVKLFDVYKGESIPPGTKSLAYALTYLADDRTLVDKEVDKAHKAIENRLKHMLKARIRGQES